MEKKENLRRWHFYLRLRKIFIILAYTLPTSFWGICSYRIIMNILTEQSVIKTYLYATAYVIAMCLFVFIVYQLLNIRRRIMNKRFSQTVSKEGMNNIRFINRKPCPEKEKYYKYKVKTYGIGIDKLSKNKGILRYSLKVRFIAEFREGKRDCTIIYGEPRKLLYSFFNRK